MELTKIKVLMYKINSYRLHGAHQGAGNWGLQRESGSFPKTKLRMLLTLVCQSCNDTRKAGYAPPQIYLRDHVLQTTVIHFCVLQLHLRVFLGFAL